MKYIVLVSVLFLAACIEDGSDQTDTMRTICLDGVQYWTKQAGHGRVMTPRIDPVTLAFVRCEEK